MAILAIIASMLIFFYIVNQVDKELRIWMIAAYVAHLGVVFVLLPLLKFMFPDIITFHSMTEQLLAGEFPLYGTGVEAFIAFQSMLYIVFDRGYRTVAVFNSLFAVLLVLPIRQLARDLYSGLDLRLNVFTIGVLFMPNPFLQLTLPLRDTLALLAFFTFLATIARAVQDTWWWGMPAIPLAGMVYLLRSELILLSVVGVLALGGIYVLQQNELRPGLLVVLGGIASTIGFYLFTLRYSFDRVNIVVQARANSRAAYLDSFSYTSWADVIVSSPVRALYFQYAPFPLHISNVYDAITLLMLPVLVVLTVAAYRSLTETKPDLFVLTVLGVIYIGGIVGYGLIDSNYGTTIRHRTPFIYLLIIFSAPVLARWEQLLLDWSYYRPDGYGSENEDQRETQESETRMPVKE